MALTDAQKAKVRRYLGFPDINRQGHANLEGAMTALSAEGEVEVEAVLANLATIETTLEGSWGRQKVVRAEEVTLAGADEIRSLRAEARRFVSTIAAILDVQPRRDVFGGASTGLAHRG
jgi:hypothetical protein